MSDPDIGGVQRLFARVIAEPALAAELRRDPSAFADRFGCSRQAAQAVAAIPGGHLTMAAHDIIRKRRNRMADVLPFTFAALEAGGNDKLLADYFAANPPFHTPNRAGTRHDAGGFATFLRKRSRPSDRQLGELAAFEVLLREGDATVTGSSDGMGRPLTVEDNTVAGTAPGTAFGSFHCTAADLYEHAAADRRLPLLPDEPAHYVVRCDVTRQVQIHHVHEIVIAVLAQCDGRSSAAETSARLGIDRDSLAQVLTWAAARDLIHVEQS